MSLSREGAPRLSVLVPAYNAAACLARAVDSALAQSVQDLEVIVVDDSSTDTTAEVAERLARRDARVRVLRNASNLGPAAARQRALDAARGEWIALLDADDAWLPGRLARLLAAAETWDADIVSDDVYRVSPDGRSAWSCLRDLWYGRLVLREPIWLTPRIFIHHRLGVLQPLVRRAFVVEHPITHPSLRLFEDLTWSLQLLLGGARWLQVPEAYYLYYESPGSATAVALSPDQQAAVFVAFDALLAEPAVRDDPRLAASLRQFIRREYRNVAFGLLWRPLRERRVSAAVHVALTQPATIPAFAVELTRRVAIQLVRRARNRVSLPGSYPGLSDAVRTVETPQSVTSGSHEMPTISVVMPTYNGERWVGAAIESILSQTFHDYELIVVDDGSSDRTVERVQAYAEQDPRIRLIQTEHAGVSHASNVGLEAARAPWIARMDADDIALPSRLERQLRAAERQPNVVLWGTSVYRITESGRVLGVVRSGPASLAEFETLRQRGEGIFVVHPTVLMKTDVALRAGGYDSRFDVCQDLDLYDRIATFGPILTLTEPLLLYRLHASSITSKSYFLNKQLVRYFEQRRKDRLAGRPEQSLDDYLAAWAAAPVMRRARQWLADVSGLYFRNVGLALDERRYPLAAMYLAAAFATDPLQPVRRLRESLEAR